LPQNNSNLPMRSRVKIHCFQWFGCVIIGRHQDSRWNGETTHSWRKCCSSRRVKRGDEGLCFPTTC
jgi:hypothetical protein